MLVIKPFSHSDLNDIVALTRISLGENYTHTLYHNISENWPTGFLVAQDSGHIIGFIAGVLADNQSARILMLAVREGWRCRGIGTALLNAFMRECGLKGLKAVHLEVRKSNVIAIRFYSRFGFQMINVLPRYYADGEDGYQMWRSL
jgi:ribosomal-protein-alanine N-acetyltransferase